MANTPTTLGSLEFSQIKTSLTDYLRNQSVFAGYNFEGSAMQSLIDLLSYNTFYYAYYANMINAEAFLDSAQKEDSLISLCKPLGYTVPSKTSARATITVSGATPATGITAGSLFLTNDADGLPYNFYNLDYIPLTDGNSQQFYIYEGSQYVEFDAIPTFDYDTQKIVLAVEDFDLSTLKVTVTENIDETTDLTTDWTRLNNVGYVSQINDNIYFVERTSTGFAILFGTANSLGRTIGTSITKIVVRYLKTSGSAGNDLSIFICPSLSSASVLTETSSQGGQDKPNLDTIRFVAPKYFASQERAVTVNDYKALLIEAGYFTDDTQFNVFGGQDLSPARFGRVFVTTNVPLSSSVIDEFINFLKERSVITILPEYVVSNSLRIAVDMFYSLGVGAQNTASNRLLSSQTVKAIFNSNYAQNQKYNVTFSSTDFVTQLLANTNPLINTLRITPDNFTIYTNEPLVSNKAYVFNIGNELELPIATPTDVTDEFDCELTGIETSTTGKKAKLKMYTTTLAAKNSQQNLQLWAVNTDGTETQISGTTYGTYIAYKGVISIPSGIISTSATLKAQFKSKSISVGLNNLVTLSVNNITVV
jgi:hypothetical protein